MTQQRRRVNSKGLVDSHDSGKARTVVEVYGHLSKLSFCGRGIPLPSCNILYLLEMLLLSDLAFVQK